MGVGEQVGTAVSATRLRHWLRRGAAPFRLAFAAGWHLGRRQAASRRCGVSNTTAAQLARLKVNYPLWRIGRGVPHGPQFIAVERDTARRITAATITELETLLADGGRK